MHLANPAENWDASKCGEYAKSVGRCYDDSYPTKAQLHAELNEVMRRHPLLKLSLAHWGFLSYDIDDAYKFLSDHPNAVFDITPGGEQFLNMLKNWDEWHEFIVKYQDRIVYGTDLYPFEDRNNDGWFEDVTRRPFFIRNFFETDSEHDYLGEKFKGVKLEENVIDKIYYGNSSRLRGEPKAIDKEYVLRECVRLKGVGKTYEFADHDLETIAKCFSEK